MCVEELEIEREEVRQTRTLSVPSQDLVGGSDVSLQEWDALHDQRDGQQQGVLVEL